MELDLGNGQSDSFLVLSDVRLLLVNVHVLCIRNVLSHSPENSQRAFSSFMGSQKGILNCYIQFLKEIVVDVMKRVKQTVL